MDELYDRVRSVCQTLGYALVDGISYQVPGASGGLTGRMPPPP